MALARDPYDLDPLYELSISARRSAEVVGHELAPETCFLPARLADGEQLVTPVRSGKFQRRGARRRLVAPEVPEKPEEARVWRGGQAGVLEVEDGGTVERVTIDVLSGPQVYLPDGTVGCLQELKDRRWSNLSQYDQKMLVRKAVKRNRLMLAQFGEEHWRPELRRTPEERAAERCRAEASRRVASWRPMDMHAVLTKSGKMAPGMIYGLEFPWTADMLESFGPDWLTTAMHAAGTLDPKNSVTSLQIERKVKVTGGNNAGKFLFDVTYARHDPHLHTELFAKVPFQMTQETKGDRISSSVYKQPMDLLEINTYRLLESSLPVATPKYYFGDISNETSNFILITARIPFAGMSATGAKQPGPSEVEGPYDKCMDWQLRGDPFEYYTLLMQAGGRIAGAHKAGILGSEELLDRNHFKAFSSMLTPESVQPSKCSGEEPAMWTKKLEFSYNFVSVVARPLFASYASTDEFRKKFFRTFMTWNAYRTEIEFWKVADPDYSAMGHQNMNADNAYFWRKEGGELECGVIDWGGFGVACLGHKLWWCINCADFEHVRDHFSDYLTIYASTYHEAGGPRLDLDVLRLQVLLTSLGNTAFMVLAVPNCYTMCSMEEFASIRDRKDPRVAENIFGKSTLRTTLHVLDHGMRILEEMDGDEAMATFVKDVFKGAWGFEAKSKEVVWGPQPEE